MNFIKKHKKLCIVGFILIVLFVMLVVLLKSFSVDYSVDEYGDRLEGISKVEISSKVSNTLVSEIKELEQVKKVNYRLKGRLVYIEITFNDEVAVDNAKEIAEKTLDYFTDKQKEYYDFQFILSNEKDIEGYPELGSKHKSSENIVW